MALHKVLNTLFILSSSPLWRIILDFVAKCMTSRIGNMTSCNYREKIRLKEYSWKQLLRMGCNHKTNFTKFEVHKKESDKGRNKVSFLNASNIVHLFLFCSDYGNDADEPARVILEVTICDKVLWIPVIWLTTSSYYIHLYKFVLFQCTHPIHHYHSSNGYGNQGQPMASEVALFNYQPLNPPSWGMYSTNVPVIPIKCLLLRVINHTQWYISQPLPLR